MDASGQGNHQYQRERHPHHAFGEVLFSVVEIAVFAANVLSDCENHWYGKCVSFPFFNLIQQILDKLGEFQQ